MPGTSRILNSIFFRLLQEYLHRHHRIPWGWYSNLTKDILMFHYIPYAYIMVTPCNIFSLHASLLWPITENQVNSPLVPSKLFWLLEHLGFQMFGLGILSLLWSLQCAHLHQECSSPVFCKGLTIDFFRGARQITHEWIFHCINQLSLLCS